MKELNFEKMAYRMPALSTEHTESTVELMTVYLDREEMLRLFDILSSTKLDVVTAFEALDV